MHVVYIHVHPENVMLRYGNIALPVKDCSVLHVKYILKKNYT